MKKCLEVLIFNGIYFHIGPCLMAGISTELWERKETEFETEQFYTAWSMLETKHSKETPATKFYSAKFKALALSCIWRRQTITRTLKSWDWRMMRKSQKGPVLMSLQTPNAKNRAEQYVSKAIWTWHNPLPEDLNCGCCWACWLWQPLETYSRI